MNSSWNSTRIKQSSAGHDVDLISLFILLNQNNYQLPRKPLNDLKNVVPGFMSTVGRLTALGNTL